MYSSALYKKAPVSLQSFLISSKFLFRRLLREGAKFEQIQREIQVTECLSASDIEVWREAHLGLLLAHAVVKVPFYRELGLADAVAEARPVEAIKSFPFIDKKTVRENGRRFLADDAKRPIFKGATSGTTGSPLTLYQDLDAINRENAFIWRQLKWAGFKKGGRRAWIRGDMVVPAEQAVPPYWRMNHAERMLMFSSCHLSDEAASLYIDALTRFDPDLIQAYPSAIGFLAKWLESNDLAYKGRALKAIVTSSETLDVALKDVIQSRFGCRVFDWYGLTERVVAIGTCSAGHRHLVSDYAYVELLGDGGMGEGREIVGTGFNNFSMPLIRYRTGDFIDGYDVGGCECGLEMPLVGNISGRGGDFIVLKSGRMVGPLNNCLKSVNGILEAQFVHCEDDSIVVRIVPSKSYGACTNDEVVRSLRERGVVAVDVRVEVVESIERSRNGKLKTVVEQG